MDDVIQIIATQGTTPNQLFGDLLPLLLILAGLTIAGGIVLLIMRRTLHGSDLAESEGFTLQGLRDLHASGQLSDEEFEASKTAIIEQIQQSRKAKPSNEADNPISDTSDEIGHDNQTTTHLNEKEPKSDNPEM